MASVAVLAFLGGGIYGFAGTGSAAARSTSASEAPRSRQLPSGTAHPRLRPRADGALAAGHLAGAPGGLRDRQLRTGGDDDGTGQWIFTGIALGFGLWSLVLVLVGVREVHGRTLPGRSALLVTALALLGLGLLAVVIGLG